MLLGVALLLFRLGPHPLSPSRSRSGQMEPAAKRPRGGGGGGGERGDDGGLTVPTGVEKFLQDRLGLKKEAVDAYAKEVSGLRGNLVQFQSPLDMELTGNEFQGRLAEQVERLQKLATEQKVELPEEFRLDFDRWVNQPAPQMAVPKLDFQLER